MLSPQEEMKLKMLLEMMKQDPYYHQMYHQMQYRPRMDVSHRLRDEMGRFLPNDHNLTDEYRFGKKGELLLDLDDVTYEDEPPRKIKLQKVDGSYGTYKVEDKLGPGDVIAGIAFIAVLIASFLH